jgi:hypothetical protein
MPKKKDPSVTFLNKFGYNVVKLPRVGIEPLDVIGMDETTQWLGPLSAVWKSSVPVPEPSKPRRAAPVNGQKTDQLDLSFGLKILGNALAAFGASVPSLDVAYHAPARSAFLLDRGVAVPPLDATTSPVDAEQRQPRRQALLHRAGQPGIPHPGRPEIEFDHRDRHRRARN